MPLKATTHPFLALILVLLCCVAAPLPAADWPLDRGNPARTGVSTEALAPPLKLRWKFDAGKDAFETGPAIAGGVAYAGTRGGKLYAIDLATGQPRWQGGIKGEVATVPCVDGGRLYVGDTAGNFACFATATGKPLWSFSAEAEIHSSAVTVAVASTTTGTTGTTATAGTRVLFGSYDQNLYCLDATATTGTLRWKLATDGPVHCSPTLGGGRVFIAGCDHQLRAVDLATGQVAWQHEMPGYAAASPALLDGKLYVPNFGGNVLAIDAATGRALWHYPAQPLDFPFYASAALTADLVVAAGRDKQVHAIDRVSGAGRWTFATKGEIDAAPIIAGPFVFVASKDGTLYALDLKTGQKQWEYVSGAPFPGSPALGAGCLVVGDTEGKLFCFEPEKDQRK